MKGITSFRDLVALITISALTACGGSNNSAPSPTNPSAACAPDVPVAAGLFTSPPTDINQVSGVRPLGNLNPGGGHVLSVDHMYLNYATPNGGGTDIVPVYAMGDGEIIYLIKSTDPGGYDYELHIKHSCSVASYFIHLHGLSPDVEAFISTRGGVWQDISGTGDGPWLMFLGQPGGAPTMPVAAGDPVGITRNYSVSWDVGVIDKRFVSGSFLNSSPRRYPDIQDFLAVMPTIDVDYGVYQVGHRSFNAACFLDYLDNSTGMRDVWFDKLTSTPRTCGQVGWDVSGRLSGAWFNPAIDAAGPEVLFDIEAGALSIIPDNYNPLHRVQIGFGNDSGDTTPSLALLDPSTWSPPIAGVDQIRQPFFIASNPLLLATVNPDPAVVDVGKTVCYDLPYWTGDYNYVLFHMTDSTTLRVKYDPTDYTTAQCTGLSASYPVVDDSWGTYIR